MGSVFAVGCASPGPPRPPSLHLPEPVRDLRAQRVGGSLELNWTTPTDSTDGLPLNGQLTAEVCEAPTVAEEGCQRAAQLPVQPGPSRTTVALGAGKAAGPPALLVVRVRILNATGKAAGWSAPAFTAAGAAPQAVAGLHGSAMEGGARLEWTRVAGAAPVLLHRTLLEPLPAAAQHGRGASGETDLQAADPHQADPGGALDRTALENHTYRYTAQRVETAMLGGRTVELLSQLSAAVTVRVHDVFPPAAPTGLATVPGTPKETAPAIELSWEPNTETDLAGYWLERAEVPPGAAPASLTWVRLTPELLTAPAFRDTGVVAGHRYLYRVIAVDTTGNASAPGGAVGETAAAPEP